MMIRCAIIGFLVVCSVAYGQSYEKARKYFNDNELLNARSEVDKALGDPANKNDAKLWYLKGKVYAEMAVQKNNSHTLNTEALEAMRKYYEFDHLNGSLIKKDGYNPLDKIYKSELSGGSAFYNSNYYAKAFDSYTGALRTFSFMKSKGLQNTPLDSSSTLYAAISADRIGLADSAVVYYRIIADFGIKYIQENNMLDVYKWIVQYFTQRKQPENELKYLEIGRLIFPKELFWYQTELEDLRAQNKKNAVFHKYEQILNQFPDNYIYLYNYGFELYQSYTVSDGLTSDSANALKTKAIDNLEKCLTIRPDYPDAALVLGQIYFNSGVELQEAAQKIKTTDPQSTDRIKNLRVQALVDFSRAVPYCIQVLHDFPENSALDKKDSITLFASYDVLVSVYGLQKKSGDLAQIYYRMGLYHEKEDIPQKALVYYMKAASADSTLKVANDGIQRTKNSR
jgi:hypothetical protein